MAANYHIEDIYQGGYSSLDSDHGSLFTGYRGSIEKLGLSTDPRTANILKEFSDKLAPGQKVIELSLITPEVLEAVPKQHLKEIQRLSKLTGVEPTIHGPLFDASGVTQQGFDEANREVMERKILNTLERSHELNPDGNIPVTFHTSGQVGGSFGAKYKKVGDKEEIEMMPVVNQDTGQITAVKKREVYSPDPETGEVVKEEYDVEKQLRIMNSNEWDHNLQQLIVPKEHADRILREVYPLVAPIRQKLGSGEIKLEHLDENQKRIFLTNNARFENAHQQLGDIQKHLNSIFDKAYKVYESEENNKGIEYLKNIAKEFSETAKKTDVMGYSSALQNFMGRLRPDHLDHEKLGVPKVYIPAEKFAIKESAKTFGNTAWDVYQKAKKENWKGIPLISIENPPAGFGLSRAQDVKDLVEGSRDKFVERAIEKGMSKSDAEKQAEKLIGATWDVGHINQLRQFGFTSEDIIKEAEKVAPLVKHVHLSDNFGMENVELPMGMGNVDLKEVMEKLGKKGEEARKIVEAAHWWQFHQTSPMAISMEALGSPIYSMNMGPYWNQTAGLQQGYFGGLQGNWLPQGHYETFGGGFSQLPSELGGQRAGAGGSRMGGRQME